MADVEEEKKMSLVDTTAVAIVQPKNQDLVEEFNISRSVDHIEQTSLDLGAVINNCLEVLKWTPDLNSSPKVRETWEKIKNKITDIIENSQKNAVKVFKAGMQVQIVNSSVETMEEFLCDKDEKKAIEKLRLNKKESQSMI